MSASDRLDALAAKMQAEAMKLEAAGSGAADIMGRYLDRMLEAARSAGLGDLSAADLAGLRRKLLALSRECAWKIAGAGNRDSWAFGKVVEALKTASSATNPILALAGVAVRGPAIDADALASAFQRLDRAFKGASADMARAVEDQLVRMATAGATPKEISRALLAQNVVDPVAGMTPPVRAETIARTETMAVYRRAVNAKAARAPGLTHWRCVGPMTSRTDKLCMSFVGRTLPESAWRQILGPRWENGRGFHPKCRHTFQPCRPEWHGVGAEDPERTGVWERLKETHDKDESLPAYSLQEFLSLPAGERAKLMANSANGFRLRGAA